MIIDYLNENNYKIIIEEKIDLDYNKKEKDGELITIHKNNDTFTLDLFIKELMDVFGVKGEIILQALYRLSDESFKSMDTYLNNHVVEVCIDGKQLINPVTKKVMPFNSLILLFGDKLTFGQILYRFHYIIEVMTGKITDRALENISNSDYVRVQKFEEEERAEEEND
jgi:hypothetical protein